MQRQRHRPLSWGETYVVAIGNPMIAHAKNSCRGPNSSGGIPEPAAAVRTAPSGMAISTNALRLTRSLSTYIHIAVDALNPPITHDFEKARVSETPCRYGGNAGCVEDRLLEIAGLRGTEAPPRAGQ